MSLALNSYDISCTDPNEPIAFETQIQAVDMAIENLAKTARLSSLPISTPFSGNNRLHSVHLNKPMTFSAPNMDPSGPTLSYNHGTSAYASPSTGRVFQSSTSTVKIKFDPFEPITGSGSFTQTGMRSNSTVAGLFGSPSDSLKWSSVWGKPVSTQVRG